MIFSSIRTIIKWPNRGILTSTPYAYVSLFFNTLHFLFAPRARITGCTHVTAQWNSSTQIVSDLAAVEALSDALMEVGPISVTIDATLPDFYFYNDGLFYNPDCSSDIMKLDHIGVLPRRVWGRQQCVFIFYFIVRTVVLLFLH